MCKNEVVSLSLTSWLWSSFTKTVKLSNQDLASYSHENFSTPKPNLPQVTQITTLAGHWCQHP